MAALSAFAAHVHSVGIDVGAHKEYRVNVPARGKATLVFSDVFDLAFLGQWGTSYAPGVFVMDQYISLISQQNGLTE
jgi:DNA-binding helix-hairpin-helix protein with protein kinase domain